MCLKSRAIFSARDSSFFLGLTTNIANQTKTNLFERSPNIDLESHDLNQQLVHTRPGKNELEFGTPPTQQYHHHQTFIIRITLCGNLFSPNNDKIRYIELSQSYTNSTAIYTWHEGFVYCRGDGVVVKHYAWCALAPCVCSVWDV